MIPSLPFTVHPIFISLVILLNSGVLPLRAYNEDAAADAWMGAYLWIQVGRGHAEKGQIPLALGSYVEALRQLEKVAERFPGYEEKMVQYRIENLTKEIATLGTDLSSDDRRMRDKYLEFIHLIDRADAERFEAEHAKALATLKEAQTLLGTLIRNDTGTLHSALSDQEKRLVENIAWLDQILHRPTKNSMMIASLSALGRALRGTTEFITDDDMPDSPGPVSAGLFPR